MDALAKTLTSFLLKTILRESTRGMRKNPQPNFRGVDERFISWPRRECLLLEVPMNASLHLKLNTAFEREDDFSGGMNSDTSNRTDHCVGHIDIGPA